MASKNGTKSEAVDLGMTVVATPVRIGTDEYLLDPGEVPLLLKLQIEDWVNNVVRAATDKAIEIDDYEANLEAESVDLTRRALAIDEEKARAYGPLARWKLLRFLANGLLPPGVTRP